MTDDAHVRDWAEGVADEYLGRAEAIGPEAIEVRATVAEANADDDA